MYTINDVYGYKNFDFLYEKIDQALIKLKLNNVVFSIIFIDDPTMKELNTNYRHIEKTTDVLSFALEDDGKNIASDFRLLGDIYVSIPQMIRQATEYNHREERELLFLIIHGLLHLLGYDHMNIKDEKIMFSLQEELLDEKE